MTPRLVFRRAARVELLEARNWYDAQRLGLGDEFARSIGGAIARIEAHPKRIPIWGAESVAPYCSIFPMRFYYRPHADRIEVIAVFHHRRDPSVWQGRAEV